MIVGQKHIIEDIKIQIDACKKTDKYIPHIMLYGPEGHGKTSIAKYIAELSGFSLERFNYISTNGSKLVGSYEIEDLCYRLKSNDILFVDEVHTLGKKEGARELFYTVLENFEYPGINVPKFTCIAATTDFSKLSAPFRDRFPLQYRVRPYTVEEISEILENIGCSKDMSGAIARRSRNVPRIAKNLYDRVNNEAIANNGGVITEELANTCFIRNGIDENGMDMIDRKIINLLYHQQAFQRRKAMGIKRLCDYLSLKEDDYKMMYEPFLIRINMIGITGKGRFLTQRGKDYIEQNELSI